MPDKCELCLYEAADPNIELAMCDGCGLHCCQNCLTSNTGGLFNFCEDCAYQENLDEE